MSEFSERRKFEMMRNLHETSTINGFRGYVLNEYDREVIREISGDMRGNPEENEIYNIFCLGFYRGRMYEMERHIEKPLDSGNHLRAQVRPESGLTQKHG